MRLFPPILILLFIQVIVSCNQKTNSQKGSLLDSLTMVNPSLKNITDQMNQHADNAELYFARGSILFQMNQVALAAKDLNRAITLDSTKIQYYLLFADVNIKATYVPLALRYLQKAKSIAPTDRSLALKLSKTYLYLKEYDAAISEANQVLSIDNTNAEAFFLQGVVWKEKGDTLKALSAFKQAIEANPDYYDAFMQLGLLNLHRNSKIAEQYLLNTIRIDSLKYEGNYALAMHYFQNKNYKKAVQQYQKMIAIEPQNAQPIYNLGILYFEMDSIQKAFSSFNLATRVAPNYAEAYYMRGLIWRQRGNKIEAKKDFETALTLNKELQLANEELKTIN